MNVECVWRHICSKPRWLCKSNACVIFATFDSAQCVCTCVLVCLCKTGPEMRRHWSNVVRHEEVDRYACACTLFQMSTRIGCSFKIVSYCTGISTSYGTYWHNLFWCRTFLEFLLILSVVFQCSVLFINVNVTWIFPCFLLLACHFPNYLTGENSIKKTDKFLYGFSTIL